MSNTTHRDEAYRRRARQQALQWAEGNPAHNNIDDECCPDFSCCNPDLFEQNADKRWEQYQREYGALALSVNDGQGGAA